MTGATDNSSSGSLFKTMTALPWLGLPLVGAMYALAWSQLPTRLATHFDFNNQPNGWMSREGSLIFSLVMSATIAAVATFLISRVKQPDATTWALLFLFYVIQGTLLWAEESVIDYNTAGTPINVVPPLVTGIGATFLVVVVALLTRRGTQLPERAVLAEEQHGSPAFGLLLALPAVMMLAFVIAAPIGGVRFVLGFGVALMLGASAMAWKGFQYIFSPAGLEIRTLGFRLRSIPAPEIRSYSPESWSFFRGYGIRGLGNRRAYVWGNRGVEVRTTDGNVFLGHSEPEKIVHDLDLVTRGPQTQNQF